MLTKILTSAALAIVTVLLAGCGAPVIDNPLPNDPVERTVTLIFDNQTDMQVDPHFYRSASILTAQNLFTDLANRFQNFNGHPTIPAQTTVEIDFEPEHIATVGSDRAAFASVAAWQAARSPDTPVLHPLQDHPNATRIRIRFFRDNSDTYRTSFLPE